MLAPTDTVNCSPSANAVVGDNVNAELEFLLKLAIGVADGPSTEIVNVADPPPNGIVADLGAIERLKL